MWLLCVSACMVLKTPSDVNTGPDGEILDFLEEEKASREAYFATPLSFEGRLVGMDGQPQEGLTVEIQNQVTQSDPRVASLLNCAARTQFKHLRTGHSQ